MSIYINLILSTLFFLAVEALGLWYLNYKIVISPDRLIAAHWVFQISVITAIVSIMTTPYDAVIIAHERMKFYAYMSIVEGLLKLGIVFLLSFAPMDKLVYYSLLLLSVSLLVRLINVLYCKKNFQESHCVICWDWCYFRKMASFAGWNFLGNTAYTLTQNGLNMVLNYFGGPVLNAARGIAYQVSAALQQFVANIVVVVKPFCIKSFGEGSGAKMTATLYITAKSLFIIQLCIALPFLFFTKEILCFWLGQVPEYSVDFLQLILLNSILRSLANVIDVLFQAVGKLKYYQVCEGIILALPVLASYLFLKAGAPYYVVFICVIFFEILNQIICCIIAQNIAGLKILDYIKSVIIPCIACLFIACVFYYFLDQINNALIVKIILMIALWILELVVMFFIGIEFNMRRAILSWIKQKYSKSYL